VDGVQAARADARVPEVYVAGTRRLRGRGVWKIDPLASMSDDEIVDAVAPNLQRYIQGDISKPT
jgi:hypothetical protein